MALHPSQYIFSPEHNLHNRDRAAFLYSDHAFLKQHLSTQLFERLEDVSRQFECVLDLGAHTGVLASNLAGADQIGQIICLEPSRKMAEIAAQSHATCRGDLTQLPFADRSFDLITSLQALHWVNDLPTALLEIKRCLKPDGLLLAGLIGGGSLKELRTALVEAETEIVGGISPRLSPLPKLYDMAALLQRSGFALPVVDAETIRVRYSHPMRLLSDLKGMAEQAAFAVHPDRPRRPLSRRILARMCEIYQERFSDPDGKVRASFEIIWLSAWAPAPNQPKPLKPGSATHSLAAALKSK